MKIYVSDNIYEYLAIGKRDIHSGVDDDLVVKSLEQHEAKIRKPLEEEIERLKTECNNLTKMYEVIAITKKDDTQKKLQQERLKVIAELEEWLMGVSGATFNDNGTIKETCWVVKHIDIKQKLNEMKGESE